MFMVHLHQKKMKEARLSAAEQKAARVNVELQEVNTIQTQGRLQKRSATSWFYMESSQEAKTEAYTGGVDAMATVTVDKVISILSVDV